MKSKSPIKIPRTSPNLLAASLLALTLNPIIPAHAANLFWDGTDSTAEADGGLGTWDSSTTNWSTAATAGSATAWTNANNDTAVFGGTAGTVTLGTGITVGGLQFDTAGYTVSGASTLTFGAAGNIAANADATISSVITAAAGTQITKTGSGTLTLSGANTFNKFSINAGTVKSGSTTALGQHGTSVTIGSGATWDMNGFNTNQTSLNGAGSVANTSGTAVTLSVGNISGSFSGAILETKGKININKSAGGTQTFGSTTNAYTGIVSILNGGLTVASLGNSGIGSNGTGNIAMGNVALTATLTYNGSATADADDRSIDINGAVTGGGAIVVSSGTGTLTLGGAFASQTATTAGVAKKLTLEGSNAGANTMAGVISNTGGVGDSDNVLSLTKSGTGTWVLAGDNTYKGLTTVSGGMLLINGDQSASTGAVSVASGATLSGSGTVGGATTIANGAFLAAGNSPGVLSFTSDLTLNATSTTTMELAGNDGVAGTDFDKITVGGKITFNGTLKIVSFTSYNINQTESYDLFDFGSSSGDFANVSVAATAMTRSGDIWTGIDGLNTYSFDQGNGVLSVTASAVPEPATYAALAGLGILGFAVHRRRRS